MTAPEFAARRLILPTFTLTEICREDDVGAVRRTIRDAHGNTETYDYRVIQHDVEFRNIENAHSYNVMPIVVDSRGVPWREANLYILWRLEDEIEPLIATYHTIASDLSSYKTFLDTNNIPFDKFPAIKLYRPTYRFRAHINAKINAGEISDNTGRRQMTNVISLYKWSMEEDGLVPENVPWVRKDSYIQVADNRGKKKTIKVQSTDLAVKVSKQKNPYAGTLDDGGKLRPLPWEEQDVLFDTLEALGNTEMTLMHLIAWDTGARIQTVCTFRAKYFLNPLPVINGKVRLPIGPGTGIDTKNDKNMVLEVSDWLFEKLHVYANSKRAKIRRNRASTESDKKHLFLSSHGLPFYTSKEDQRKFSKDFKRRHLKVGQAIRQYIKEAILPLMRKKLGEHYKYKFHDLRATFGMNLTEDKLILVMEKQLSLHEVREYVKTRMGHDSAEVTDRYLNYRVTHKLARSAQLSHESNLRAMTEKVMKIKA